MEGGLAAASSTHAQGTFVKVGKKVGKPFILQKLIGKNLPEDVQREICLLYSKPSLPPKPTCIYAYVVHVVRMKEITPTFIHCSLTFLR